MKVFILLSNENKVTGVYSTQTQLVADLTTTFANLPVGKIETWEIDKGFIDYLKVNKKTTVTIED